MIPATTYENGKVFYSRDGELWYRDWCFGNDDFARNRMERQAEQLSAPGARCPDLAEQAWQAIRDFDEFWAREMADVH